MHAKVANSNPTNYIFLRSAIKTLCIEHIKSRFFQNLKIGLECLPLVYPPQDTQSHLLSSSSHSSITGQSSVSRLPKLSLPTFTGNPLSWQTFYDSFSAAVDSSPTLSGVQKFSYLRAQLQGEAARAVAGFPLTDANYIHSVTILKERFGQTPKIVSAHMQALMNLPKLRNNVEDLRNLYDYIERTVFISSDTGILWCSASTDGFWKIAN